MKTKLPCMLRVIMFTLSTCNWWRWNKSLKHLQKSFVPASEVPIAPSSPVPNGRHRVTGFAPFSLCVDRYFFVYALYFERCLPSNFFCVLWCWPECSIWSWAPAWCVVSVPARLSYWKHSISRRGHKERPGCNSIQRFKCPSLELQPHQMWGLSSDNRCPRICGHPPIRIWAVGRLLQQSWML